MKRVLFATIVSVLLTSMAFGVSIAPEIIQQLRDSGQLEAIIQKNMEARSRGVWQPNQHPYQRPAATTLDTLHCLLILVDFSDMQSTQGRNTRPGEFDTLLFSEGIRNPGSMNDYYLETSYGQVCLTGQITQWYRMPQTYAYYVDGQRGFGSYPHNAQRLTEDAVAAADPDINFDLYDNDDDGYVDALFVVHAGPGYEDTGNLNYIHSHAWSIHTTQVDQVYITGYSMEPEETGSGGLIKIGVFCHEFGHVLGLPDLYDYDYDSDGTGMWSIMSGGSWGGGGATPVHFDGWSKLRLGWVNPTIPTQNLTHEQIDAVEYSPDIYVLYSHGIPHSQYFIVENRRQRKFDVSIPGSGLLIYHVDETVQSNDDQTHYHVAVEQADGDYDLENNRGSDNGDPWPGSTNNRTFDDTSVPNSNLYFNIPSDVSVDGISNSDSIMYANLKVLSIDPNFENFRVVFYDSTGNLNNRPDTGETCRLWFEATNTGAAIPSLIVTVHCSDSLIGFSDSISNFAAIGQETFNNGNDGMTFSVPGNYGSHFVDLTFTFTARDGQYIQQIIRYYVFGSPGLLLVDDDGGGQIDTFYANALRNLNRPYVHWDIASMGTPVSQLSQFPCIIWFTGDSRTYDLSIDIVTGLINYLNAGGKLFITSQDFVQSLAARNSACDSILLKEYLKVGYLQMSSSYIVDGLTGTPFTGSRYVTTGAGGAGNQISQDALVTEPGGTTFLVYYTGSYPAAVGASPGNYKALTVGFGIEGINGLHPQSRTREEFLDTVLSYLGLASSIDDIRLPLPKNMMLTQNYPNPFNASTTISYAITSPGLVCLDIFDVLGRLVATPVNVEQAAGNYQVIWNADEFGSGIYFYRLQAGNRIESRRMLLLK
jgi:immune inhibitor A